jgi:hypothetical protein
MDSLAHIDRSAAAFYLLIAPIIASPALAADSFLMPTCNDETMDCPVQPHDSPGYTVGPDGLAKFENLDAYWGLDCIVLKSGTWFCQKKEEPPKSTSGELDRCKPQPDGTFDCRRHGLPRTSKR